MLERKPGRILFWVSMGSGMLGWVYAFLNQSNRDSSAAFAALFCWFVAFWTGAFWLKLKWVKMKASAQAAAWSKAGLGTITAGRPRRGTIQKVLAGVGIAIGVTITALLAMTAYFASQRIPRTPNNEGVTIKTEPTRSKQVKRRSLQRPAPSTTVATDQKKTAEALEPEETPDASPNAENGTKAAPSVVKVTCFIKDTKLATDGRCYSSNETLPNGVALIDAPR